MKTAFKFTVMIISLSFFNSLSSLGSEFGFPLQNNLLYLAQ